MKKIVAGICAGMMLVGSMAGLTGCGNPKDEKEEISIAINAPDIAASEGTVESNRWTKYIEENSGVKVKWIGIPQTDMPTKMNTMLAAGSAPDMFVTFSRSYVQGVVDEGMLKPLDEIIDKYSNNYKAYMEENRDLETWTRFGDETYVFTGRRPIENRANFGMWIRQDWLDKLGLAMPTTDDELIEVAKAFKTLGDDIVPIAYPYWFWPSLHSARPQWYAKEDGTLEWGIVTDRYGDAVSQLKRCYDEGLLDSEFFIDNGSNKQIEAWNTGKSGILFRSWNSTECETLLKNDPTAKPVPVPALETKNGRNGMFTECPPYLYVMMNKNCKNEETCMKLIDWMIGGGWRNLKFGEEGVHYKMDGEIPVTICDPDTVKTEVRYANNYMLVSDYRMKPEWITKQAASDALSQRLAALKEESLKTVTEIDYRRDLPFDPPVEEVTKIVNDFSTVVDSVAVKAITGGPGNTIEACMQDLRDEWKRAGGEKAEQLATEWYLENKDKLSLEGLSIQQ